MTGSPHPPLAQSLQTLFLAGALGDVPDGRLLERFLDSTGEASAESFRAVVDRHAPMVLGVCRRVLGDVHEAEDASQAAFLVLARRARSIRGDESVGPWLFQVAHRIALRARKSAAVRRLHEQKKAEMDALRRVFPLKRPSSPSLLDDEIRRLPARLRAPLILCHLEGLTQEQAATHLGQPLRTVQRNLAEARKRLRTRLIRQGHEPPEDRPITPAIVAASWVESTTRLALQAHAGTALTTGTATAMAYAYLRSTLMTRITVAVSLLIFVGGFGAAGVYAIPRPQEPKPTVAEAPQARPEAKKPTSITITVVDEKSREPLAGAEVQLLLDDSKTSFTTDAKGKALVALPDWNVGLVRITVRSPRHVPILHYWNPTPGEPLPSEATVSLERGTTIGGRVVDKNGSPIAGATTTLLVPARRGGAPELFDLQDVSFTTDARGAWRCDVVPEDLPRVWVRLSHPNFLRDLVYRNPPIEKLRDRSDVMVMEQGVPLEGMVLDEQGRPIAGARVMRGTPINPSLYEETTTDAEGRFRYAHVPPGDILVIVQAPGRAPDLKTLRTSDEAQSREFRLKLGHTIRGRVLDVKGQPVAGVKVVFDEWRGYRGILKLEGTSDADGRLRIDDAPEDVMTLSAQKPGYMLNFRIAARPGQETAVTMRPEQKVSGAVVDTVTRRPIPKFTLKRILVLPKNVPPPGPPDESVFQGGKYEIKITNPSFEGHRLRVEAEGYQPAESRPIGINEGDQSIDFELIPRE